VQPLLLWKSNKYYIFWGCVCSLRYTACNASAPYYHLWPVSLYNIFPHYLLNRTIFEKKFIARKICVLSLSTNFVRKISCSKKNLARYGEKCILFLQLRTVALRLIVRPWLDVPTLATRRLHACHYAMAPSGGRWNFWLEMSGNFALMPIYTLHLRIFYMP
jgi:hypothetical protein